VTGFLNAVKMLMVWQSFASVGRSGAGLCRGSTSPRGTASPRAHASVKLQRKAAADWSMSSSNSTVS